jgi:membrane-bound serine protease (ClpP class)
VAHGAAATPTVDVIEVSGLVDAIVADFVEHALADAERASSLALVVQLDSSGTVVGPRRLDALANRLRDASVPVAVWVGPSGADAKGDSARLVAAADVFGLAPGSHIEGGAQLRRQLAGNSVSAPTLGDFIVGLDGRTVDGRTLSTATVVQRGDEPRREPSVRVRFAKLGLFERLLHTASSPAVAFLLVLAGMLLIVFEFFSAGVGVAGVVGAGCLVLSGYGLGALPTNPLAAALLILGILGFSIDVQAGAPRAWTVIGTVALLVGTFTLYDGVSLRWPAIALGIVGVVLFMLGAMPSMLRARFGTPTIGRDSMIGAMGRAAGVLDPEGMVSVGGADWRARTNRATPIAAGSAVRVIAIDGLLLEVEPEEGAARDHRPPTGG